MTDGSEKAVVSIFQVPEDADLSTVNPTVDYELFVTAVGSGNDNVSLELECQYLAVGDLSTLAAAETKTDTFAIIDTLHRRHQVTFTLNRALISAGDFIVLRFVRLGADVGVDNYTGSVGPPKINTFNYQR